MKSILVILVSLLAGGAYAASNYELDIVKAGCGATKTYEEETKCYRSGVTSVMNDSRPRHMLIKMCGPTKTYESESKCYRAAVAKTDNRRFHRNMNTCIEVTQSYENEAKCMRRFLQQRRDRDRRPRPLGELFPVTKTDAGVLK